MTAFAHYVNAATPWAEIACCCLIFGGAGAWLIHGALTGKKPSAAEVARAQQMAATPAHPAGKAIPEPEPFDAEEWEARYAAANGPERGQR